MSAVAHYADSSRTFPEVREVPIVLQKSPSGLCEIEICNYRIGAPVLLNRCCAFQPDLESIFLAEMLKILFATQSAICGHIAALAPGPMCLVPSAHLA